MLFHIQFFAVVTGTPVWERAYALVAGLGWAGVDLFFVLSGFLITGILYESRGQAHYFRVFYLRRTVRIFPLYYGTLLTFFVVLPLLLRLGHVVPSAAVFGTLATQVFAWSYAMNWVVGVRGFALVSPFITHFWSLSVEEQFYLGWPAVVRGLSRHALLVLCGLMAIGASLLRLTLFLSGYPTAAYVLTFARMDGLAVGAVIALASRDADDWATLRRWAPHLTAAALAAFVGLVAQTSTTSFGDPAVGTVGISLLCLFFGGVLVLCTTAPTASRTERVVGSRVLRWFGKHSYCLYIVNQPVVLAMAKAGLTAAALQSLVRFRVVALLGLNAGAIAMCSVTAFASWHLFEKHWLALKSRPLLNHSGVAARVGPVKAVA